MQPGDVRLRVRYAETDQMGIVYHANYLVWMEMGRVEYFRARGFNYRDMEGTDQILLAVVEAHCRYLAPARYDDEVLVHTKVVRAGTRLLEFGYELSDAQSGRRLAQGGTTHMFVSRDLKPVRLPLKYYELFGVGSAQVR